jgi:hypothetical protein
VRTARKRALKSHEFLKPCLAYLCKDGFPLAWREALATLSVRYERNLPVGNFPEFILACWHAGVLRDEEFPMKPIHSLEFLDRSCRWNTIVAWLCSALLLCAVVTSSFAAVSKDLLVASFTTGTVTRLDGATGATVYSVPQGTSTINMAQGPDGAVYVSTLFTSSVNRVDFETGAPLGVFASGGGIATAVGVAFGPDGNL